ncbi:MAG: LCP family protein [Candidatus Dormibacteraceae bacterium]
MSKARLRARRSRYSLANRLTHSVPAMAGLAVVLVGVLLVSLAAVRIEGFLSKVTGHVANPLSIFPGMASAAPGSIAWKLQHGQQVHLLLLGYAGSQNDAPYLTDSIMAATLDPATGRVSLASIPRDLWVNIVYGPQGQSHQDKINAAFEIGSQDNVWGAKLPQYSGRDGGGHLAEKMVGQVTGLQFDGYVAVNFQAFRDVVNALGGVSVHLDQPLHDCHYPNYHDGYLNHGVPADDPRYTCPSPTAGIYFPAGTQSLNGERALELARSRHADNPAQASDFGRAQRQQMIIAAIKQKALSVGGVTKLFDVMTAIQNNIRTDVSVSDLQAIYSFGGHLPASHIVHLALTNQDLLAQYSNQPGPCGPVDTYRLCPIDPSYRTIRHFFADQFVPQSVLKQWAPVTVQEATWTDYGLQDNVSKILGELGFNVQKPGRAPHVNTTVVYDYSGGKDLATAQWLASYFGGTVATPASTAGVPAGVVVVLGTQFGLGWLGQSG